MTDIGIRDISVSFHDNKISNISLVQGDALTRGFDITFVNAKGETLPVDDDYVVELIAVNSKDKDTPYACRHEIVDDKYRVMIPPEALSESGSVTIQLVFYQKSTKAVIHTIKQKCPVYQSIGQEFVESNNLYVDITALRLGLERIDELDSRYESMLGEEKIRQEAEKKRNEHEADRIVIFNEMTESNAEQIAAAMEQADRVVDEAGDVRVALEASISDAEDINFLLSEPVGGTIKLADDMNTELEGTIVDAQTAKSDLDDPLTGAITLARKVEDDLTNPTTGAIKKAEDAEQSIQDAITNNQIVTLPVFNVHKEEYIQQRQQDQLKVATVEKELNDYKSTMANLNVNQEVKQKVSGYGVVSLPKNAANGQVSVRLKGNTVTDENSTKSTISASRLKSVGKNLLPKTGWSDGTLTSDNGEKNPTYTNRISSPFIKVKPNATYTLSVDDGYSVTSYFEYDINKNFIKWINSATSQLSPQTHYVKTLLRAIPIVDINTNILKEVDVLQLEEGNQATPYKPYTESTSYLPNVGELRSLPNGTKDEIRVSGGKAELVKRIDDDGITELIMPIITPVNVSGSIVSNPSGTVYVDHATTSAGIYNQSINVTDINLPIKTLEKISKIDFQTGTETELDTSTAVISTDKLSFTHPTLEDGDIVFFEYAYDLESTEGETTVEFYDSRYVLEDTEIPGKFYKIVQTVSNGELVNELVEV